MDNSALGADFSWMNKKRTATACKTKRFFPRCISDIETLGAADFTKLGKLASHSQTIAARFSLLPSLG